MIAELVKEEKMYVMFSNNVEADQRGSYLDVEGIKWHAWKREKVIACTSRQLKVLMKDCMANVFDFEAKYHLGKANVGVVPWSRKERLKPRRVRAMAMTVQAGMREKIHLSFEYKMAPFEALYRRKYRSPILWAEIGESSLIGPELVQETTDKVALIKEKLKAARDRQKKDPFAFLDKVRLCYRLRLPEELSGVHDTFHVSKLKKCLADASLHVPLGDIKVDKTLRFVEERMEIIDCEVKSLKRSKIALVKVRWDSKRGPEFTWEREDYMKSKYPQLFVDRADESAS
ncbi:hypothetical protein Tco_0226277 [Tanacetum coccineum]